MKKGVILFGAALLIGILLAAFFTRPDPALQDIPTSQPTRADIVPPGSVATDVVRVSDETKIPQLLQPTSTVRKATTSLISKTCAEGSDRCKLQAIYDFVRKNYEYVERSVQHTYFQSPAETLLYGSGDELELSMLIVSMNRAAGFDSEVLQGPYHTFVRTYLGKEEIIADPSCQGCRFMDVRVSLRGDETVYR